MIAHKYNGPNNDQYGEGKKRDSGSTTLCSFTVGETSLGLIMLTTRRSLYAVKIRRSRFISTEDLFLAKMKEMDALVDGDGSRKILSTLALVAIPSIALLLVIRQKKDKDKCIPPVTLRHVQLVRF
jgi:hypothetical protein